VNYVCVFKVFLVKIDKITILTKKMTEFRQRIAALFLGFNCQRLGGTL